MRILALEPYYGGSHRAFLDGWIAHSRHEWKVLGLPAYKWKWRMRHSAIYFAELLAGPDLQSTKWDLLFCSDMLNLAEFLGLSPFPLRQLPTVVYFHENQLTYPVRVESERDYQFAMTNLTTAITADSVWFNTAFHRDSFLDALRKFLKRMPDHRPIDAVENIFSKSEIHSPGIRPFPPREERKPGPLRILWAARWEHDKNPEIFFDAVEKLDNEGVDFRLNVIGERFRDAPGVFAWAEERFRERILHWGFQPTRAQYEQVLKDSDVVVSTANHEFFGISVVEAVAAGAYPLLPPRLSYPEIFGDPEEKESRKFFYDGTVEGLADKLLHLERCLRDVKTWSGSLETIAARVERFYWPNLAPEYDSALELIMERVSHSR